MNQINHFDQQRENVMNVQNILREPRPNDAVRQDLRVNVNRELVGNVPRPQPQFVLQDELLGAFLHRINSKLIPRRMLTGGNMVESLLLTRSEF